jgi:AraC family transcriptional regulator, regulatory protein of adaptative response / DNA-3-methyladenine glycosylase II
MSAVHAVRTTGIYCRPACGARPRPENVTVLPSVGVARAAGYRACLRCRPGEAGAAPPAPGKRCRVTVPLVVRRPFDGAGLLAFLSARAVPGVEAADGTRYRRSVRLAGGPGRLELDFGAPVVVATVDAPDAAGAAAALAMARRLADADADPRAVAEALAGDPLLAAPLRRHRGLRSPGAVDGPEIAVRALVGQQISVAGARTILGRLAAEHGAAVAPAGDGLARCFPGSAALAGLAADALPMPRARGRALAALAGALAGGVLSLEPGADRAEARSRLLALPGIGPWTADYVLMRALGDRDVLLSTDLGVRRAVEAAGGDGAPAAVARRGAGWAPWRSYATHALWASLAPAARAGS